MTEEIYFTALDQGYILFEGFHIMCEGETVQTILVSLN